MGCSSDEELCKIAITLNEFKNKYPKFDYTITGTDISTEILQNVVLAVYKDERIVNIPLKIKKKYFLKSKERENRTVRIVKTLRDKVNYQRLNFMDYILCMYKRSSLKQNNSKLITIVKKY